MTALIDAGAPMVSRKINPSLLMDWMRAHPDAVGKIREADVAD